MRIVTLTLNPSLDENTTIDAVVPERKLRCARPTFEPGGGGINVARAIHQLGGEALALWTRGGATGAQLHDLLRQEGIGSQPIDVAELTRTNVIVFEERTTLQYRFGMPGPRLSAEELQRCADAVAALKPVPEYLVVSGSLPPGVPADFVAEVVRRAPSSTRVVVDTSGEALRHGLAAGAFLVKPNLRELADLVGRELTDDASIDAAVHELTRGGACHVAVSLGAGGALLAGRNEIIRVRAPTVPIRSKVGAGDSMVAGMVLALTRGMDLREAFKFGIATGSATVMRPGTQLARREDAEALYASMS